MKIRIILFLLISSTSWAESLKFSIIDKACEKSKSTFNQCRQYSELKDNIEEKGKELIGSLYFGEEISAVTYFLIDPKFEIKEGSHQFIVTPRNMSYSFSF